jgi:putative FmdB family regulatory protein
MPYYEYRCDECDDTFEVFQSMNDEPLKKCPHCSSSVRRVFSANSIIFKGSGFYSTDTKAPVAKKEGESSTSTPTT